MESEGYIRLDTEASISSKELYEIYLIWCEENSLLPLKSRSFSDGMVANLKKYQLEHSNNIINSAGRRVWGFVGIEVADGFDKREIYDNSQRIYIHRK